MLVFNLFGSFGFWSFEFVSDFEFRVSDLVAALPRCALCASSEAGGEKLLRSGCAGDIVEIVLHKLAGHDVGHGKEKVAFQEDRIQLEEEPV